MQLKWYIFKNTNRVSPIKVKEVKEISFCDIWEMPVNIKDVHINLYENIGILITKWNKILINKIFIVVKLYNHSKYNVYRGSIYSCINF